MLSCDVKNGLYRIISVHLFFFFLLQHLFILYNEEDTEKEMDRDYTIKIILYIIIPSYLKILQKKLIHTYHHNRCHRPIHNDECKNSNNNKIVSSKATI